MQNHAECPQTRTVREDEWRMSRPRRTREEVISGEIRPGALYKTAEAAMLLNVHQRTIQAWIRDKKLPAKKVGATWRLKGQDLLDFQKDG